MHRLTTISFSPGNGIYFHRHTGFCFVLGNYNGEYMTRCPMRSFGSSHPASFLFHENALLRTDQRQRSGVRGSPRLKNGISGIRLVAAIAIMQCNTFITLFLLSANSRKGSPGVRWYFDCTSRDCLCIKGFG